ncbi:MAG: PH domain-containing protein [Abditibacteriota bacterium]|nr:PH domain-containing protein [Abditibacteriota bacterium]
MAFNFNGSFSLKLKPIGIDMVREEVNGLLIEGENIEMAFQTIRDQVIFTDKRIISIDVQGFTGTRKSYTTMPYSKIQYFSIQTPGFLELIPDSELFIMFSNTFTAKFDFKGNVDIGKIGRMISKYVLE